MKSIKPSKHYYLAGQVREAMEKGDKEKGEPLEIGQIGNPLYCSYEDGKYVYKDPETSNQFVWVESERKWVPHTALGGQSEVSFDAESNSYTYTDPEGTVFQWDPLKSAWFPKVRSYKMMPLFLITLHPY